MNFRKVGTSFLLTGERYSSDSHMLLSGRLQHAHASHISLRNITWGKTDSQTSTSSAGLRPIHRSRKQGRHSDVSSGLVLG